MRIPGGVLGFIEYEKIILELYTLKMERKGFVILDLICLKIFVKFNPNYFKRNERKTNEYKHNQNKTRTLVSIRNSKNVSISAEIFCEFPKIVDFLYNTLRLRAYAR